MNKLQFYMKRAIFGEDSSFQLMIVLLNYVSKLLAHKHAKIDMLQIKNKTKQQTSTHVFVVTT